MRLPDTRRDDTVETLHGHVIADPYRWLEDPDSPETAEWVAQQNAVTRSYLDGLPSYEHFQGALRRIVLRPTAGAPWCRGGWYVVNRNDGTQPQDTWYAARSLEELEAGGRVLLEPSTWSADGTTSLNEISINRAGTLAAYAVSEGGSDWQRIRVLDLETFETRDEPDVIGKFSSLVWLPDDATFFYRRYDDAGRADGTSAAKLPHPRLALHTVGTDAAKDRVVLEFPDDPQLSMWPIASSDGRWVAVMITRGTERRSKVWVYPTDGAALGEPLRVVDDFRADVSPIDVVDDVLYCGTDEDAPHGRLVAIDLTGHGRAGQGDTVGAGEGSWRTVVAEDERTLVDARIVGSTIVTEHLDDAKPVLGRWTLDGQALGRIDVPAATVLALSGEAGRDELLLTVTSFTSSSRSFHVNPSTAEMRALSFAARGSWAAPDVVIERLRATSEDGTQVPYWLIRRADTPDGGLSTLLYGYGGFNIPVFASFSAVQVAWVEAGGAVAVANLRGGGEFGTQWYDGGRRAQKQRVFDDFAAVARDLVERGATSADRLAAYGGSNGGLLVGALITQHPELVAAAAPMVGVLDLLRFHKFTIGSAWISDYGDPDVAEDFEVALAYSPLHNVHDGERYPATIVVTGDHDDRVVPAHSHKFTATLQRAQGGEAPVLTRIETSAGHGMGKSREALARECADLVTFLAHHAGLEPRQD